jgi:hypothetical protein
MSEMVLVGGPFDGNRFSVPNGLDQIIIPICKPIECAEIDGPLPLPIVEEEFYEKRKLRGSHEVYEFYKHVSITMDEAIEKLLKGYLTRV